MLKLTELIDKYLLGELNAEELKDFEDKLKNNPKLQKEVEIHKTLLRGIEIGAINKQVQSAQKTYLIKSIFIKTVVTLLIAGGIGTLTYLATHTKTDNTTQTIDTLKEQNFTINVNQDTLLETQNGMVFIIPAHAFDTESDSVEIKIEEALDAARIIMKGLSTVSDSLLLETAGMFKFDASVKGNKIKILKEITASLPTDKVDKDMMLFKGEEDNKGNINWVNPKKLQQELVTYDIEKLNFLPKGYLDIIDTLYHVQGINEESKRIYFEMSGYKRFPTLENLYLENMSIGVQDLPKIRFQQIKPITPKQSVKDSIQLESVETITNSAKENKNYDFEIDPSRIRAIWNKKFNKTILATKEFEERLKFIFTTCNPEFINYYINNLNKPLFFIDSLCANSTNGSQREKFLEFYHKNDGGVNISDNALAKLHRYYEQKFDTYKAATAKTWKAYFDNNKKLDQQFADKSTKKIVEESICNSKGFNEELCKNLTNAYAQIGMSHTCCNFIYNCYDCNIPKEQAYTFTISNNGWYNLDKYVLDATIQRKTLGYTDPVSGKKAIIIYSKCTINIKNNNAFDFVNVYSLPNELSSYQRMRKVDNLFTESLNMSFNNNIVVVAKKGKDWYWNSVTKAEGKTYIFALEPIKEFQLKLELNRFNHSKKKDIIEDMAYHAYAEEYQKDLKKRTIEAEEKRRIAAVIFPCSNYDTTRPVATPPAK